MQNWVIFFLGLLFAVPIGFFVNIYTPKIQSIINQSFLSSREKRIQSLLKQYQEKKKYRNDPTLFIFHTIQGLASLLMALGFMIIMIAIAIYKVTLRGVQYSDYSIIGIVWVISVFAAYYVMCFVWITFIKSIDVWKDFSNYEGETIRKLVKLGGNPEDLDKEESKE